MKLKLEIVLAIISIIGYLGIFLNALFDYNLAGLSEALLFIIIGTALMFAGGLGTRLAYVRDGIQIKDITKLLTFVVGASAVIVGLFDNPLVNISLESFRVIKLIVSGLAIMIIVFEMFYDDARLG